MSGAKKFWIALGALLVVLFFSSQNFQSYWKKKRHLKRLQNDLSALRADTHKLSLEIERIKNDPRILEQHARRELGLIQDGEIEYRFFVQRSTH